MTHDLGDDTPDLVDVVTALDLAPGRRPGLLMRALTAAVPGVRLVRGQVEPYAARWRERTAASLGGAGRRWVVLGDSMAQGVGASAYDRGWVGQLDACLRADGVELEIVNLSATGARTTDVLERQLPAWASLPSVPDGVGTTLVTVMIGSNDLFGGRAARERLPSAMAELVERLPDGAVVTTLPQPRQAARLANVPVERAAAAGRLRLVDLRSDGPSSWRGLVAQDFFHPNDGGYAALADALEPAVRRALGEP